MVMMIFMTLSMLMIQLLIKIIIETLMKINDVDEDSSTDFDYVMLMIQMLKLIH